MDTQEFRDAMTSLGDELSAHVRYLLQVISFLHGRLWCLVALSIKACRMVLVSQREPLQSK